MFGAAALCTLIVALTSVTAAVANDVFVVRVIDEATGRGVPLVELRTTANVRYYSDSNGIVSISEPGLEGQDVFFHVSSHGYIYPNDGFSFRGQTLKVRSGSESTLKLRRNNVAERLYRVTGAGIYRDSVLAGKPVPIRQPVLNAQVTGSDSVQMAEYRGRLSWFWGDTNRLRYPLGNFSVTGATSILPTKGGLSPDRGVNLRYFVREDGFARPMTDIPGEGMTWLSGLVVLGDSEAREQMFAHYVKVKASRDGWDVYARGLAEYDDTDETFKTSAVFRREHPFPSGAHTLLAKDRGDSYVYYCDPYPFIRVLANPKKMMRQDCYESFTCLKLGAFDANTSQLDRDAEGRLRYGWKVNSRAVDYESMAKLVKAGAVSAHENIFSLRDIVTDKPVRAHRGTVYPNAYRNCWVMITGENWGTSLLGETWYAEADHLLGPWVYARKIVTHDDYSFYNPKQHPMFDQHQGRIVYFEGTYTRTFSGTKIPTPRYDYNQIMYRLNLDDTRLFLPAPVYRLATNKGGPRYLMKSAIDAGSLWDRVEGIAFFALPNNRQLAGSVPIFAHSGNSVVLDTAPSSDQDRAIFYAFPVETGLADSSGSVPLYRYIHPTAESRFDTHENPLGDGWRREQEPLCRVWRNPSSIRLWRD